MEEIHDGSNGCTKGVLIEKRARPQEQLNCPRCNSTNTKFCYYNNYSLTQPRYFCKTCRRYWTEGGTLRNVPVGGGSRKNRKSIPPPPPPPPLSSSSSSKIIPDLNPLSLSVQQFPCQNPRLPPHQGQDLNPSFNDYYGATHYMEVPKTENDSTSSGGNINNNQQTFPSGFYLQPTTQLGFCVDGLGSSIRYGVQDNNNNNNNNNINNIGGSGGRILFPFGDNFKQVSNAAGHEVDHRNKGQGNTSTGYWNGLLGGGSSW